TIGLFQGMLEKNTLTFNPGWDRAGNTLPDFDDVRDIQKSLKGQGLSLVRQADESSTGPAHLCLVDPDGNPILIDQHVPRPACCQEGAASPSVGERSDGLHGRTLEFVPVSCEDRPSLLALEERKFMTVKHLSTWLVLGVACTFARGAVPEITAGDFDRLLEAIKPQKGESPWREIPWLTNVTEARRKAS